MYQLVDFASTYSLRRWKPTYIHLINIPSDEATSDGSWCLVASHYTSVTECSSENDTAVEKRDEKRIATVWGKQHEGIQLTRLTTHTKITFDNNSYSLFLGSEREDVISILEAQIGNKAMTAKVAAFKDFGLEEIISTSTNPLE